MSDSYTMCRRQNCSQRLIFSKQWRRQDWVYREVDSDQMVVQSRSSLTTEIARKRSLEVIVSNASVRDVCPPTECLAGQRHRFIHSTSGRRSHELTDRSSNGPSSTLVDFSESCSRRMARRSAMLSWKSTKRSTRRVGSSRVRRRHKKSSVFLSVATVRTEDSCSFISAVIRHGGQSYGWSSRRGGTIVVKLLRRVDWRCRSD